MRRSVLPLAVCLSLLLSGRTARAQPAAGGTLGLDEALSIARENRPALRQVQANARAADARADQARAPLLPQLSGTASYQRTTANFVARPSQVPAVLGTVPPNPTFDTYNFFNFGLTATQLVYDSGLSIGRNRAAHATADAAHDTASATALDVELSVRTAFFQARAAKALIAVADETVANQERHVEQVQGFVDAGTRPEIDLAQVRTGLANARLSRIQAVNAYATAKAQLNQAMGIETGTDYEVAEDTIGVVPGEDSALEPLMDEALRTRPEFRAFANRIRAQELVIRQQIGGYGPSIGVSTSLTDAGNALSRLGWNWNAGVTVSWLLYQGGLTRGQVDEARATLAAVQAESDGMRQQVRLEVQQAQLTVAAARVAVEAAEEVVRNARTLLDLAEGRYGAGVGNAIELADAQLSFSNAEAQYVRAAYDLAAARARLLRALGRTAP